jgi:hypothetical protein
MNQEQDYEEDIEDRMARAFGYRKGRKELRPDKQVIVKIIDPDLPRGNPVIKMRGGLEDNLNIIGEKLGIQPQRRRRG